MGLGGFLWGERTWGDNSALETLDVQTTAVLLETASRTTTASAWVIVKQSLPVVSDAVVELAPPVWRERPLELGGTSLLIRETIAAELTASAHMGLVRTADVRASALIWRTGYQQESVWLGGVQVYGELTERSWLGGDEIFYVWMGLRVKADAYVQADHREVDGDAVVRRSNAAELEADGWIKPRPEVLCDAIVIARFGRIFPVPHAGRIVPLPSDARASRFDPRPK